MLKIENLDVSVGEKEIIKNLNLNLEKGKVFVLMGPNGSGKSTLANTLMGSSNYNVKGKIMFEGKNITKDSPDKRAKNGIFLSFQSPSEVSGVPIFNFLRQSYNSIHKKKLSILEFEKLIKEKAKILNFNEEFFERYINEGFSGGEKKKSEILQLLVLNPKLAILDETDSGLDIDSLRAVSNGINKFSNKDNTILIITHYKRILKHLNPDRVLIMDKGSIVLNGGPEIIDKLEEKGYDWIKNDKRI